VDRDKIIETYNEGPDAVVDLVENLSETIEQLSKENAELKDKISSLQKDSTNSSKPPSSDGLKKKRGKPKRGSSGRKPGGQKGHPGKTRSTVPQEKISKTVDHKAKECENCCAQFSGEEQTKVVEEKQVTEIPKIEPLYILHRSHETTCDCGHTTREPIPEWAASGQGEELSAMIGFLTGPVRLSRRKLKEVLEIVFNVRIALGTVQNDLEETSDALGPACDELKEDLSRQRRANIDETSYPHNKKLHWLWAFVTGTFVLFVIRASRGSKVLREVLGVAWDGIMMCDRFSAYVKYHKDRKCGLIQFCWAHIIRTVKGLKPTLARESKRPFSQLMRQRIGAVFRLWHAHRRGAISRQTLIEKAERHIDDMRSFLEENVRSEDLEVAKLCKGLLDKWESLFTFIYHEGVEPTNNAAERALRPGVQTRKISYCTRSEKGQELRARLLTVSETCRIQGRNALEFFRAAIHAKRHHEPPQSLLPVSEEAEQVEPAA